jgi:hypothetical protein
MHNIPICTLRERIKNIQDTSEDKDASVLGNFSGQILL